MVFILGLSRVLAVILGIEALEHILRDIGPLGGIHDVATLGSPENEGVAFLLTVLLEVGVYLVEHGFSQALIFLLGLLLNGRAVAQQLLLLGGAGGGGRLAQGLQLGTERIDALLPACSLRLEKFVLNRRTMVSLQKLVWIYISNLVLLARNVCCSDKNKKK